MQEQNRWRLRRIAERFERDHAEDEALATEAEKNAAFNRGFARICSEVLEPVIAEIGEELRAAGHDYRVENVATAAPPRFDYHVVIRGRTDTEDVIRFFVHDDDKRGREVIAEIVVKEPPSELTRFQSPDELTRAVAEQMLVDAIEQLFAYTAG